MTEARADGPRGLLLRLARNGADAAAPEPHSVDDAFGGLSAPAGLDPREHIRSRLNWYVAAAPVILRLVVLPGATVVLVGMFGVRQLLALVGVVAVLAVADGLALRRAAQLQGLEPRHVQLSLVLSLVGNLAVAANVPASLYVFATAVTGTHLLATVVLWTLVSGGNAGLAAVAVSVPMHAAMVTINEVHDPSGVPHAPAFAAGVVIVLLLAVATSLISLTVLGFGTRLAMTVGMHAGREAERALLLRRMHDTVLQTLETMALQPVGTGGDAERALRRLRYLARGQAIQIRRALDALDRTDGMGDRLADDLTELAEQAALDGLHVQLALGQVRDAELTPAGRAALRDAAAEALRNAVKHSGVHTATLRLDEVDDGITVIVRDHGSGFDHGSGALDRSGAIDTSRAGRGFGIRQCIRARLAEAGGHAEIWSRPGRGTRVTLWVPLAGPDSSR